jgi:hypothetical protein
MKNKLFLTLLAAIGLAGSVQAQTTTFVDVANLGDGVSVLSSGGTVKVNATVLTKNQRWTRDRVYILANNVIVPNGITLTIEPGTLIRAEQATIGQGSGAEAALTPADPGALVVARGGRLIAAGTADAPIIFTSIDDPNVPGGIATIPPSENIGSTASAGTTTTVVSTNQGERVITFTNNSSSNNLNVIRITSATGSTLTNTAITNGGTTSFTNYSFGSTSNWFRLSGTTTNWFSHPTLSTTYTNLAAARTLKSDVTPVVVSSNSQGRAGIYTVTGTGTLSAAAKGYGAWAASADSAWRHDGLWGGIVLAGNSTVNRGYDIGINANTTAVVQPYIDPATGVVSGTQRGVQQIEGMAGFADYAWGGGDVVNTPDDSGILRFISNRYGGFIIAANAELNSYSFYGVGRGTVLEFLEAWNNADDDFEFWGGDVGMRYALSLFCGDDGLDTDQGFLGAIQYFVQIQNNASGNESGSSVTGRPVANYGDSLTENDGPESDNRAVPLSTYILSNATLVGRGYGSLGSWNTTEPLSGPNFKDNAGARWHNSIIMDNPHGAVLITDRSSTTNSDVTNALAGSSIGRFAFARTNGGFDGADRGMDLVSTNTGASDAPDGRFHSCMFFRNGLAANSGADGEVGKYTNNAAFQSAVTNDPTGYFVASNANLFPTEQRRAQRGAAADGNTNRANTAAVIAQLTNASNYNSFNTDPGLNVNPYSRLSGLNLRPSATAARSLGNSSIPNVRGLNTNATYAGAVLDNAWMRGWTISDKLGLWAGTQYVPEVQISLVGTNPKITFGAAADISYVVERSTDNKSYVAIATVSGGLERNAELTDTGTTLGSSPVFYRVIAR